MRVDTGKASGAVLRWLVAMAEGYTWRMDHKYGLMIFGPVLPSRKTEPVYTLDSLPRFDDNWEAAGLIIVDLDIQVTKHLGTYYAWLISDPEGDRNPRASGSTYIEAAMRCDLNVHLGEVTEIEDDIFEMLQSARLK